MRGNGGGTVMDGRRDRPVYCVTSTPFAPPPLMAAELMAAELMAAELMAAELMAAESRRPANRPSAPAATCRDGDHMSRRRSSMGQEQRHDDAHTGNS